VLQAGFRRKSFIGDALDELRRTRNRAGATLGRFWLLYINLVHNPHGPYRNEGAADKREWQSSVKFIDALSNDRWTAFITSYISSKNQVATDVQNFFFFLDKALGDPPTTTAALAERERKRIAQDELKAALQQSLIPTKQEMFEDMFAQVHSRLESCRVIIQYLRKKRQISDGIHELIADIDVLSNVRNNVIYSSELLARMETFRFNEEESALLHDEVERVIAILCDETIKDPADLKRKLRMLCDELLATEASNRLLPEEDLSALCEHEVLKTFSRHAIRMRSHCSALHNAEVDAAVDQIVKAAVPDAVSFKNANQRLEQSLEAIRAFDRIQWQLSLLERILALNTFGFRASAMEVFEREWNALKNKPSDMYIASRAAIEQYTKMLADGITRQSIAVADQQRAATEKLKLALQKCIDVIEHNKKLQITALQSHRTVVDLAQDATSVIPDRSWTLVTVPNAADLFPNKSNGKRRLLNTRAHETANPTLGEVIKDAILEHQQLFDGLEYDE
jgi:hypothetical protein